MDSGVVEAAESMGAGTWQIIRKVLLPEARPSLINNATVATITILGYSAMAGFTGGGGLGDIATRYGLYKFDTGTMVACRCDNSSNCADNAGNRYQNSESHRQSHAIAA